MGRIRIGVFFALLICSAGSTLSAQRLVIDAPGGDVKVKEYLTSRQFNEKLPLWVEFFYAASRPCRERLEELEALAQRYAGRMEVLLLSRDSRETMLELLDGHDYHFAIALDDEGKTFAAYDVKFVPFSVLLDAKDRVVWFGNSQRLPSEEMEGLLER